MFKFFKKDLEIKKLNHLYREITEEPTKNKSIDFTSNDYLNLSTHPYIRAQMIKSLEDGLSLSSKSSRLLAGTSVWHQQTEKSLANFTGRQAGLSFSSGYLANIGIIPALAKNRVIFSDELNHASLIDGIRLSKSPCHVYPHNNFEVLENLLKKEPGEKIIITESLFSMTGNLTPLTDLSNLAKKYEAILIVDEAHATGIFGSQLSGFVYDLKQKSHIISIHTLGKALGSSGAFVACSGLIKDYLINNCRSFIYTTAPPPLLMIQWQAALDVLKNEAFRALKLREKSLQFRESLKLAKTESPIVFINLKDSITALNQANFLKSKGFNIRAIRPPTVPTGKAGLRIVLQYAHTQQEIALLKQVLQKIIF